MLINISHVVLNVWEVPYSDIQFLETDGYVYTVVRRFQVSQCR